MNCLICKQEYIYDVNIIANEFDKLDKDITENWYILSQVLCSKKCYNIYTKIRDEFEGGFYMFLEEELNKFI